jgi:hypothetical protein
MDVPLLYSFPLWGVAFIFLVLLLIALESGFRVGLRMRNSWKDAESGGGAVVLTSMFALLGLVLAFTYASGVSRFDARKNAVIQEANSLGTAFHRADLVAEPGRTELKRTLLEYARTRAFPPGSIKTVADLEAALKKTLEHLSKIWPATKKVIEQGEPAPRESSLVAAINGVLDVHTVRLAAVSDRLPRIVIWMLVFIAAASLAVAGYNAGIQGRMSRWRMSAFALVLTGLMIVIMDFDRPNDGFVIVSNHSIYAVIAEMEANLKL